MFSRLTLPLVFVALAAAACSDDAGTDAGSPDAASPTIDAAPDAGPVDASPPLDFTETYEPGTADVGYWTLTTEPIELRPRIIETTGGNPDGYLYSEVSKPIPAWSTASTRYQPGVFDEYKRDSVFVGDFYANDVKTISADMEVIQVGNWATNRAVSLHLLSWDTAHNSIAFDAYYSLPDLINPPTGWNPYSFQIDARSRWIPHGWMVTRGDGTPGTDADWATMMHQIDLVEFCFWKPGYAYPSMGLWSFGIDNIHISALEQSPLGLRSFQRAPRSLLTILGVVGRPARRPLAALRVKRTAAL